MAELKDKDVEQVVGGHTDDYDTDSKLNYICSIISPETNPILDDTIKDLFKTDPRISRNI